MGRLRALLVVLALASVAVALVASAPAAVGVAVAHPEPKDLDGDTVLNELDNCVYVPNGAQVNTDSAPGSPVPGDGLGDACDDDDDNDGIADAVPDNCRIVYNPDQLDADHDGHGDACPPVDTDADGRLDEDDNCPQLANAPGFADTDGDDKGDACDRDDDNDFFDDGVDNCPLIYNPTTSTAPPFVQADLDGDGIGSECDPAELIAGPAGPGSTPVGPSGTAAVKDTAAPKLTLSVQRRVRLSDAGASLVVKATCSEACDLDAVVAADANAARRARLGTKRITLASGSWSLAGAGKTYVFARLKPAARKLRSGRKLAAALRVTAKDAAGNKRTVTRPIELRR